MVLTRQVSFSSEKYGLQLLLRGLLQVNQHVPVRRERERERERSSKTRSGVSEFILSVQIFQQTVVY
jgi:hypothetical protein